MERYFMISFETLLNGKKIGSGDCDMTVDNGRFANKKKVLEMLIERHPNIKFDNINVTFIYEFKSKEEYNDWIDKNI